MINFYDYLRDRIQGRAPRGARRSSQWRRVRNEYLEFNPKCVICGSTTKLEVHHIIPFYIAPKLELKWQNLMTLCSAKRYGIHCHLLVGHRGAWQRINESAPTDAKVWADRLRWS